jgi:hypothetical protein
MSSVFKLKNLRPLGDITTRGVCPVFWTYHKEDMDGWNPVQFFPDDCGLAVGDYIMLTEAGTQAIQLYIIQQSILPEYANAQYIGMIGGGQFLSNCNDVHIENVQDGEVLKYDGNSNQWINAADATE